MRRVFDGKDMHTIKSRRPRDILNEIKWKGLDIKHCTIYYIHRGAPGDTKAIPGSFLRTIGRSFFETIDGTSIPYHRILRIYYHNHIIFDRYSRKL